jgi:uncharacterized protein YndB with AHSA1/START domain
MTEPGRIRLEKRLSHAPAKVWAFLTDPALLSKWWAPNDIQTVVGHRFHFDMGQWGKQPCEILAVEPERFLSYTFAPGTLDTTITWTLAPDGEGTLLEMVHEGFDLDSPMAKAAFEGMSQGWPAVLDKLAAKMADLPA